MNIFREISFFFEMVYTQRELIEEMVMCPSKKERKSEFTMSDVMSTIESILNHLEKIAAREAHNPMIIMPERPIGRGLGDSVTRPIYQQLPKYLQNNPIVKASIGYELMLPSWIKGAGLMLDQSRRKIGDPSIFGKSPLEALGKLARQLLKVFIVLPIKITETIVNSILLKINLAFLGLKLLKVTFSKEIEKFLGGFNGEQGRTAKLSSFCKKLADSFGSSEGKKEKSNR